MSSGYGAPGGGVSNSGTLTVTDSTISDNSTPVPQWKWRRQSSTAAALTVTGLNDFRQQRRQGRWHPQRRNADRQGLNHFSNSAINGSSMESTGTLTVETSTLSGNSAAAFGGGINSDNTATVEASTISGNTAGTGSGGGIVSDARLTLAADLIVKQSAWVATVTSF